MVESLGDLFSNRFHRFQCSIAEEGFIKETDGMALYGLSPRHHLPCLYLPRICAISAL